MDIECFKRDIVKEFHTVQGQFVSIEKKFDKFVINSEKVISSILALGGAPSSAPGLLFSTLSGFPQRTPSPSIKSTPVTP